MLGALWVSKTGLEAEQQSIDIIANNLANVNTNGFKESHPVFADLVYQTERVAGSESANQNNYALNIQFGTGSRLTGTEKDYGQGNLTATRNPLDLAISGHGFFQVQLPDGATGYTRSGNFQKNANGLLVTTSGFPTIPNITIPNNAISISIGDDGTVSVNLPGNAAPTQIGQIQLATFVNPNGLIAIGNNLLRETNASGAPQINTPGTNNTGTIQQNYLESSNVNVAEQLVQMIQAQRGYEFNTKVLQTAAQMLEKLNIF